MCKALWSAFWLYNIKFVLLYIKEIPNVVYALGFSFSMCVTVYRATNLNL